MRAAGCRLPGKNSAVGEATAGEPGRGGARGDREGPQSECPESKPPGHSLVTSVGKYAHLLSPPAGSLRGDRMVGVPHGTAQA